MPDQKPFLNQREAAKYLGISERHFIHLRDRGQIKASQDVTVKRKFFRTSDLDKFKYQETST